MWNMYREETTHSILKIMFRNETLQCCDNWLPVQYITVIWFLLTWYPVYASLYGLSHDWSQSILFFIICWSLASLASISEISAERSNESLSSPGQKKQKKRSQYVINSIKRWRTKNITGYLVIHMEMLVNKWWTAKWNSYWYTCT